MRTTSAGRDAAGAGRARRAGERVGNRRLVAEVCLVQTMALLWRSGPAAAAERAAFRLSEPDPERTVESHLTRVYRKLGVRSRTQLAAHLGSTA